MISSFLQTLTSLFTSARPKMSLNSERFLFNSANPVDVVTFLYLFTSWATLPAPPLLPKDIIDRFYVTCIIHSKHPDSPEHEFLIIETKDTTDDSIRFLVLERNISDVKSPTAKENTDLIEKFNRLLRTVVGPSPLASLEEGHGSGLTTSDRISVASVESVDGVLDSLKISGNHLADDHFIGGDIFTTRFMGHVVQHFQPKALRLYDLAIIADVVHDANPNYVVLNTQCYFYASLVFAVAERFSQGTHLECADENRTDLVEIRGSYLSNKYGRWKGMKVTRVDPYSIVVNTMLTRVYEKKATQLAQVC